MVATSSEREQVSCPEDVATMLREYFRSNRLKLHECRQYTNLLDPEFLLELKRILQQELENFLPTPVA